MAALAMNPDPSTTAVILLAAGRASRFGGDKLAAMFHGETVLSLSATTLAQTDCYLRSAVVNENSSKHVGRLKELGFVTILNDAAEAGLSRSIRLGVTWAKARGARGALIALADMPFITLAHYTRLLEIASHERFGVAYSKCAERRSPPAIFSADWFGRLLALEGDAGARELLQSAPSRAGVDASREMLTDIDTIEDLSRAER